MRKTIFRSFTVAIFSVLITSCSGGGGDDSSSAVENTPVEQTLTGVTIQAIQVELLGDPNDAYDLVTQEDNPDFEPSLESLGKARADLSNQSSEISLVDGNFYRITVEFEENIDEFQSSIVILDLLNEQSQTLIPLYTEYEELDGTSTVFAYTLIPAEIPAGEYILLASIVDESAVLTPGQKLTIDQIPQRREYGGINVTITKNPDPDTLFVVAAEGFYGEDLFADEIGYVDLFYPADYAESGGRKFTSEPVGGAFFSYYNTSEVTKVLEVRATLELEDGSTYPLSLMDPSSETGLLTEVIRLDGVHYRDDLGEFIVMYYLEDIYHEEILTKVPDLAYDLSDGNLGSVIWDARVLDVSNPITFDPLYVPTLVAKINDVEVFDPAAFQIAGQNGVKIEDPLSTNNIAGEEFAKGTSFNKDGKYSQTLGKPSLFSVDVAAEYGIKGRWSLLQIEAQGKHTADFTVFGTKKPIYSVEAEVANGLRRLSPNSPTSVETRRYGNRAVITALGSTFYNSGEIKSEQISIRATVADDKSGLIAESLLDVTSALTPPLSLQRTWRENTQLFSTRILGLFTARLFVEGDMEADMRAEFPPKVTLTAPLGLDIYGKSGIDVVIAEAGLEGRVNMLHMTNTGSVAGDLRLDLANDIVFDINNTLDTSLKIVKARVSAYTDCAIFCSRKTYNIYTTPWLFNRAWAVSNSTIPAMPQNGGL